MNAGSEQVRNSGENEKAPRVIRSGSLPLDLGAPARLLGRWFGVGGTEARRSTRAELVEFNLLLRGKERF